MTKELNLGPVFGKNMEPKQHTLNESRNLLITTRDQHKNECSLYAHMRTKSPINVGEHVNVGQIIGTIGNTGRSNGRWKYYDPGIAR